MRKITLAFLALCLSACHHENPLTIRPIKESAYFLMNASANVEKRLHLGIKEKDSGLAYLECLEGKKSKEVPCDELLEGMLAFAKEGHYPHFKNLTLADLKDPALLKLGDDIFDAGLDHWPRYFKESK